MGLLSRRSALFAAPAGLTAVVGVSAVSTGAVPAAASPAASPTETFTLVAARAKNSLPTAPTVGTSFAMLLELFDMSAGAAGDGSILGAVVNLTADTPPKVVVQSEIVLRLRDKGELHLSTMHALVVPSPVANPLAIVGGTDAYASVRGDGTISYPTADRIDLTLRIMTG
ncbi:MAG: hypothetical protein JOZ47_08235 [Kutzneria sp.]|nr:hypothetical protein [Kutzneria sp.]MBV9845042.1 hypothetical protein [Kutzneria sp.]